MPFKRVDLFDNFVVEQVNEFKIVQTARCLNIAFQGNLFRNGSFRTSLV